MNIMEKRKEQLKLINIVTIAISVILLVTGIILLVNGTGSNFSVLKIVFGIILALVGLAGLGIGIYMSIVTSAVKATQGSIAETNSAKGTVNMHKCKNCGAEVEAGVEICSTCEENLKP